MRGSTPKTILTSAAVIASVLLVTSSASAAPPVKTSFEMSYNAVITGLADFDIGISGVMTITDISHYDSSGRLVRIYEHIVEQDTFTANGKTLVGDPFTFNIEFEVNGDGEVTRYVASGIAEKVRLPDGGLFLGAGVIEWLEHPGEGAVIVPDKGACVNLEGFIEALSP